MTQPLTPKEALQMIEDTQRDNQSTTPTNVKEAIALETTRGGIEVKKIRANEGSKEVAGKHLAKAGAGYLVVLVLAFIYSIQTLPAEAVAVVAGLITLVVSNISSILKGIVETKEEKDPIELMYDIAGKNSDVCEREMRLQAEMTKVQHAAMVSSSERQSIALSESAERQVVSMMTANSKSHTEMVSMLRDALEKQPTSLSIKPDDVVIKQGNTTVDTSRKSND
jgi:hypothetical protein|tara:strand:+ start:359 stop:1030 length:672 start_codon:yes stop_codon:yes gene_type:complete